MKKVLFVTKGDHSASTRYRAKNYFPILESHGWTPSHAGLKGSIFRKCLMLRCAREADVVIIVRSTFNPIMLWLLRRASKRLVFDFDDAIFLKSSGQASAKRGRRFQQMLKKCDLVFAGNRYLKAQAERHCHNVTLLPTAVDMARYENQSTTKPKTIDLVWIGSRSTSRYLKRILPALESAAKRIPALRLKIIADFNLDTETLPVLAVCWNEATEVAELQSAHIGIAPMVDNPWTRGKCALKVLQYMASGLPVISSPAGVNQEVVTPGINGLLANSEDEWVAAIERLANNEEQRSKMGQAGFLRCQEAFSQQHCADILLDSLASL